MRMLENEGGSRALHGAIIVLASMVLVAHPGRSAVAACVGDCNGDDVVWIDELVAMVDVALGIQPLSVCTAGDADGSETISIDEIITAVTRALDGCVPGPQPTPTVQPCAGEQLTQCASTCGADLGCCFQSSSISCFDPSIQCTPGPSATCVPGWYGYTACGNEQMYDDACQQPAIGTPTPTPPATPTATTGGATPAATVTATATSSTPAAPTATATATPSGGGSTPTPTTPPSGSNRVVTIINTCSFPVWIGVVGSVPAVTTNNCSTSNPCPAGQACNTRANPSNCVWSLPAPQTGSFALAQSGAQEDRAVFFVPPAQAVGTSQQVLNVNLYGQTGCASLSTVCCADATLANCGSQMGCTLGGSDCTQEPGFTTCVDPCAFGPCGTNCDTAPCNAPSRSEPCAVGSGPVGPHTQGELNLFMGIVDSYDVSYINGLNVPMEVAPVDGPIDPGNAYFCGNPGGTTSLTGLGTCSYTLDTNVTINATTTDYAPYLRNVLPVPSPTACTPTAQDPDPTCPTAGQVCGLTMSTDLTTLTTTCGVQAGWWSADEVCAQFPGFSGGPFDCPGTTGQDTYGNLYMCAGNNASDCYNMSSSATTCCGCPVWPGVTLPPCATTTLGNCCYNTNSTWVTYAQPWANVFKTACSTAYSFPNDDVTSSFSCPITVSSAQTNTLNYQVIYCPGGLTGQ